MVDRFVGKSVGRFVEHMLRQVAVNLDQHFVHQVYMF